MGTGGQLLARLVVFCKYRTFAGEKLPDLGLEQYFIVCILFLNKPEFFLKRAGKSEANREMRPRQVHQETSAAALKTERPKDFVAGSPG